MKELTAELVKEIRKGYEPSEVAIHGEGYPLFNNCEHTFIDLSHLDRKSGNGMHTFSIRLNDNSYVTLCVMDVGNQNCVDVKYYKNGKAVIAKVIGFHEGNMDALRNVDMVTIISDKEDSR